MNSEKRYIPHTDPEWGRELPDGDDNSLVDKYGNNYDDGYNFDEHESNFDPEAAKKAREDAIRKQSQEG